MFTQCQQCKAIFQVSDAQLATANGYVRCGQCLAIFSATENERKDLLEKDANLRFHQYQENGHADENLLDHQQHDWVDDQPLFDNETSTEGHAETANLQTENQHTPLDETVQDTTSNESSSNDSHSEPIAESVAEEVIVDTLQDDAGLEQAANDESKHLLEASNEAIYASEDNAGHDEHSGEDSSTLTAINIDSASEVITEETGASTDATKNPSASKAGATDSNPGEPAATTEKEIPAFILEQMQAEQVARQRRSAIPWLLGSLFLALVFTTQYIYLSRDQLAHDPQLRPWLAKACKLAGCTLAPPYDIERIKIIGLEIFSHPEKPAALLANTAIINKADFAQPYPLLTLTFSDISGTRLAQRRFLPEEYLPADVRPETGMKPDTPIKIVLQLTDPGENAVNFEFEVQSDPRHQLAKPKLKNPLTDLLSRL